MRWLTPGGAAAAALVGAAIAAGLGIDGVALLLAFFVPASLVTRPATPREHEKPAIRGIDVEPEILPLAQIRQCLDVVHRTGVGRAGIGDHEERRHAGRAILGNLALERLDLHAIPIVARDLANVAGREAGQHRRFLDRVVCLVRRIDRA